MSVHDPEEARENSQRLHALWLRMNNPQRDSLLRVGEHIAKLGPNASLILEISAERLANGAAVGDFDPARDYEQMGLEEDVDFTHYRIARALKAQGRLVAPKVKSSPLNGHALGVKP